MIVMPKILNIVSILCNLFPFKLLGQRMVKNICSKLAMLSKTLTPL